MYERNKSYKKDMVTKGDQALGDEHTTEYTGAIL